MRAKLDHTEPVAKNIISFYWKPERPLKWTAGQFIELILPVEKPDARGRKHWFTISASPSEEMPAITTKFPADDQQVSTFKQTLRQLKPGDEVLMSDPMGDFVLPKDKTTPLIFIAGGIGITPMRSMIKWLTDNHEQRPIKLLYAANSQEEVAFSDIFKTSGLPVTYILTQPSAGWTGETGRLTADKILQLAPDQPHQLYFISGPEPMVESLYKDLHAAGINKQRLVGDYFPNYDNKV